MIMVMPAQDFIQDFIWDSYPFAMSRGSKGRKEETAFTPPFMEMLHVTVHRGGLVSAVKAAASLLLLTVI